MAKSKNVAGVTVGTMATIRRSFGNLLVIPSKNAGRFASLIGNPDELKKLRQSLANVGMNSIELADASPATESDIKAELKRREAEITDLRKLIRAAEADPDQKKALPFLNAKLDVLVEYYKEAPDTWQFTGHQRYGQYPDAMADRLLLVRTKGWEAAGMSAVPGVEYSKATAAQVIQTDYTLRYWENLTSEQIEDIQIEENGGSVGITQMTAADYAIVYGKRWIKQGFVPKESEAWLKRAANLQRGKAQHANLIACVAFQLHGKYDVIGAATLPHDHADYRNPLEWGAVADRMTIVRNLRTRIDPVSLAKYNAGVLNRGRADLQMGSATLDDLVAYVSQKFTAPEKSTALSWSATVEVADSPESCALLSGFIAACRESKDAVTLFLSEQSQLISTLRALEVDNRKAKQAAKETKPLTTRN